LRPKKRYVLLRNFPKDIPENSKFLFQNSRGYVVKTDLNGTKVLKKEALIVSGSIWKLKDRDPKLLYPRKRKRENGMK
jgi:hypothetical protein